MNTTNTYLTSQIVLGKHTKLVNTMLVAWLISFNTVKEVEDAVVLTQTVLGQHTQQQRSSLWDYKTATNIIYILNLPCYRVLGLTKPIEDQ